MPSLFNRTTDERVLLDCAKQCKKLLAQMRAYLEQANGNDAALRSSLQSCYETVRLHQEKNENSQILEVIKFCVEITATLFERKQLRLDNFKLTPPSGLVKKELDSHNLVARLKSAAKNAFKTIEARDLKSFNQLQAIVSVATKNRDKVNANFLALYIFICATLKAIHEGHISHDAKPLDDTLLVTPELSADSAISEGLGVLDDDRDEVSETVPVIDTHTKAPGGEMIRPIIHTADEQTALLAQTVPQHTSFFRRVFCCCCAGQQEESLSPGKAL